MIKIGETRKRIDNNLSVSLVTPKFTFYVILYGFQYICNCGII